MPLIVPDELHGEIVTLRRYRLSDMDAVRESIDASFDELNRWMPWAAERPTVESVRAFVEPSSREFGGATAAANYAIVLRAEDRFVGSCGLMQDLGPHALEIGYWVDSRYTGRGIAKQAARLAASAAFTVDGIDRVEIRCDAENVASAKVAEGVGFRLDRTEEVPLEDGRIGQRMIWVERRDRTPT
jgi:RimJ/RimL family protein N-acetyltransferase